MNRYLLLVPFRSARFALLVPYRQPSGIVAMNRRQLSQSSVPNQISNVKPSLARRAKKFWDDNPFTQIALLVCLLVVGVASLVEWAQNKKKGVRARSGEIFSSLPIKPLHPVCWRDELSKLYREADRSRFAAARVISIVGERGSGKTELARQFAEELMLREKKKGRIENVYKPEYYVLTVDMSSRESIVRSLLKCAALLRIPSSSIPLTPIGCYNATDEQLGGLLATIGDSLKKKRVICILDNASGNMQELQLMSSKKHWKPPSLLVIISRDRLIGKVNLEIDLNSSRVGVDKLSEWIQKFGLGGDYSKQLANKLYCNPNNFEMFSLICHSLYLLNKTTEKLDMSRIDATDFKSFSHTLQQQLPQQMSVEIERMNNPTVTPLNQLQLIALLLQVNSSHLSQHATDLLARLSHEWVLPLTALVSYLQTPLLELGEQLQPNNSIQLLESAPSLPPTDKPEAEMGYWEFIKHTWDKRQRMVEMLKQQQRPKFNKLQTPHSIEALKESPLFVWENDPSNGFQGVKFRNEEVHTMAYGLFEKTVSQMEQTELSRAKKLHSSSLLSKLSTFNPALHLHKYRSSLPGINKTTPLSDSLHVHRLSFLHRVMHALAEDFEKDAGISCAAETLKCRLLANHGEHLLHTASKCILLQDRVMGLRFRAATLRSSDSFQAAVAALREVASIQESNNSTPLVELASTYSQLGRLYLTLENTDNGHAYYQQAASLYERAMSKLSFAQQLEHANLLYRYGVELACNKQLEMSKSCLERSVAVLNVAGAQAAAGQQQQLQTLVLSAMVELAHVYISLGALSYAARMLGMAENLSKNLPREEVPDLAQLYNLKALVKSLTGDKKAYLQLKQKAGDMFANVNDKPFVY